MADQQVIFQRQEETRLSLLPDPEYRSEICALCQKPMEEDTDGLGGTQWTVGNDWRPRPADWEPLETRDGKPCCSAACRSQYEYNHATADNKTALRELAQVIHAFQEMVGFSFEHFCLKHIDLKGLINPVTFWSMNCEMTEYYEDLGLEDEPAWYLEAIGMSSPAPAPAESIRLVPRISGVRP